MKKYLLFIILFLSPLILVGCSNKTEQKSTTGPIIENKVFKGEGFSFNLTPGTYSYDENVITVSIDNKPLPIIYGTSNEKVTAENLFKNEEKWYTELCPQTDACGEIISSKVLKIKDLDAIKFTIQLKGRSLNNEEGYLNEYHYSVLSPKKHLYRFWASASDLENPEQTEKMFDEVMQTIQFEKIK